MESAAAALSFYAIGLAGYAAPVAIVPRAIVEVLTPRATVDILAAGYQPQVHCTAS